GALLSVRDGPLSSRSVADTTGDAGAVTGIAASLLDLSERERIEREETRERVRRALADEALPHARPIAGAEAGGEIGGPSRPLRVVRPEHPPPPPRDSWLRARRGTSAPENTAADLR